ncbi:chitin synthase-domain-containing protein, partial [Hygrophoropsis aurantiaca]
LGEDHYLITLLLRQFPMHKTQFARDAYAFAATPNDWKILLSQRRRWINSTTSLIMIGAVYGLQALVFILRRKWDMVGWMVFYILAITIFPFML